MDVQWPYNVGDIQSDNIEVILDFIVLLYIFLKIYVFVQDTGLVRYNIMVMNDIGRDP